MKNIEFKEKSAQKIYGNYFLRIRRTISVLSVNDQEDILMEFNSHIYEAIQPTNNENEIEQLLNITQKLGDPEEVLIPLIANKKLNQATKTFNPKHIYQAIYLNLKNGIKYSFFALLYLFSLSFLVLIISKIINYESVGLFIENGNFVGLGKLKSTTGATEVLGNWFIPVMFFLTMLLYLTITLILKATKKKPFFAFKHSNTMYNALNKTSLIS